MGKQLSEIKESYLKGLLDGGLTFIQARNQFNIVFGMILGDSTLKRVKKGISKSSNRNHPKPRIATTRTERIIKIVIKENRWETCQEIQKKLNSEHRILVSVATLRRLAKKIGITSKIAKEKPFLSAKTIKKSLVFAKKYQKWTILDLKKVIILVICLKLY